jgi:hypothetical protein
MISKVNKRFSPLSHFRRQFIFCIFLSLLLNLILTHLLLFEDINISEPFILIELLIKKGQMKKKICNLNIKFKGYQSDSIGLERH